MIQAATAARRPVKKDDNRFTLPTDKADATRVTFEKLKKLWADRKHLASRIRDVVQDAKSTGYATPAVRQAFKLAAMSPEQREKWQEQTRLAASLFGLSGLEFTGEDDSRDKKLWQFTQQFLHLRKEKKELAELFAELKEAALAVDVDYAALEYVGRLEKLEPDDREAWMERIDNIATFLGYW